jgi:hypothetical protein
MAATEGTEPASAGAQGGSGGAWLAAGLGAWGVLTGFAVFLLLWHEHHAPGKFLLGLGAAGVASAIVEGARKRIEGHGGHGGHGAARFSWSNVAFTLVLLAIVELFIVAAHTAVHPTKPVLPEVARAMLGSVPAQNVPLWLTLATFALAWVLVGAALAAGLLRFTTGLDGGAIDRAGKGAARGAVVGLVVAPVAMLAAVLLLRAGVLLWTFLFDHDAWLAHLRQGENAWYGIALRPLSWLANVWGLGWFAKVLVGVLLVGAVAGARREGDAGPFVLLLVAVAVFFFAPLLAEAGSLLLILGLAALAWGVPAATLGAMSPALEAPAERREQWGLFAFGGALLLAALPLLWSASPWFLLPAAFLATLGAVVRKRGVSLEAWPLLALAAGLVVTGATGVVQEFTFHAVFLRFHALADVTLEGRDAPPSPFAGGATSLDFATAFQLRRSALFHSRLSTAHLFERLSTSDADLERLAAAAPPSSEAVAVYREWASAPALPETPIDRAARKASLRARAAAATPAALPWRPAPTDEERALAGALVRRIDADVEDVATARGFEAHVAEVVGNLPFALERAETLSAEIGAAATRFVGPESKAIASSLRSEVDRRLAEHQSKVVAGLTQEWAEVRPLGDRAYPAKGEPPGPAADRRRATDADPIGRAAALLRRIDETIARWKEAERPGPTPGESPAPTPGLSARAVLETLREAVAERRARWADARRVAAVRLLELALAGSLGFWVSVALLAGRAGRSRAPA